MWIWARPNAYSISVYMHSIQRADGQRKPAGRLEYDFVMNTFKDFNNSTDLRLVHGDQA